MGYTNVKQSVDYSFKLGFGYILKERLLSIPIGFRFPKNHFLYHFMDNIVQNLLSGGIIDKLNNFRLDQCAIPYYKEEWEPYVFSIDHLLFGFNIWLVACAVALSVLAFELIWFYGKKYIVLIIQNTIGLYIIIKRLQRGFGL
jgi:hypothetical protein